MYAHKSDPGRKHYVVYTDLAAGKTEESPTFKNRDEACNWIAGHVQNLYKEHDHDQ